MRRAAKTDANQKQIVKLLRQLPGVSVAVTSSLGAGFPDLVIGFQKRNYLIELKDGDKPPSAQKLTPDEIEFQNTWQGQYHVCNSLSAIMDIIFSNKN